MENHEKNQIDVSRRNFLKGAFTVGAVAATAGLVGCGTPNNSGGGTGGDGATSTTNIDWSQEADIVVVGGGASGCATALSAGEAGASVILLESSSALGGCGALCVGSLTTPVTSLQTEAGVQDSIDLYLSDVEELLGEETIKRAGEDWDLFLMQANEGGKTVDWLVDHGVVFNGPLAYPHHSANRMHMLSPSSAAWPSALQPAIEAAGVEIKFQTKGVELVVDAGRVVGIKAIDQITNEELYIKANKGVQLATASVDSDYDTRVKRYSTILAGTDAACAFNDGTGIKMAAKIGADVTEWNSASSFSVRAQAPSPDVGAYGKQSWMPYGLMDAGAVMVTKAGKRYASEDLAQTEQVAELNKLPDRVGYMVYDEAIAKNFQVSPDMVVSSIPHLGWGTVDDFVAIGAILKADTIEDVAQLAGVDAAGLAAEIAKYNGYAAQGEDPDFGRKKFGLEAAGTLNKGLTTPPYYIHGPQKGETTQSNLTLAINTDFQVLDPFRNPIPGLYAGGMVGHGLSPLGGGGHGGNMTWAFTSGRLSGTRLAAL
jgi:fumarate reductase flavoprotein subunit